MSKSSNRATRCSPCKKQTSLLSASSLRSRKTGESYMYLESTVNKRNNTTMQPTTHLPSRTHLPHPNLYRTSSTKIHWSHISTDSESNTTDYHIKALLQRDSHRPIPPPPPPDISISSSSQTFGSDSSYQPITNAQPLLPAQSRVTRQQALATSPLITSNTTSQYEPSNMDHDPMPRTRPLRTRSRTFVYPHSYDSNLVHHNNQTTESHSSEDSFRTPTFYMSTTSSSSPSSQSIPPLNIKQKQPETVSPLSYPDLHPLQPYAHEQEQSTAPSVSDDSISTKTSHSITSISREIISNLSSTLQSQQCQTLIEDILQDYCTFDSLRTQVEQSQQKIKE